MQKFPVKRDINSGVLTAATYVLLGRQEEAAVIAEELLEGRPDFNLSEWRYGKLWKSEADRTLLYDAAKKAGIPEFPKAN